MALILAVFGLGYVAMTRHQPGRSTRSLGFVGFEQAPVLAEEARNVRRTIPLATFFALGMIAIVYAGVSRAMVLHNGTAHVMAAAGQQGRACCSASAAVVRSRRPLSGCS